MSVSTPESASGRWDVEPLFDNPLLKHKPRKLTETELLAWKELSRDKGSTRGVGEKVTVELIKKEKFEIRLPDLHPYISLECPDGRRGIEVGLKGTF